MLILSIFSKANTVYQYYIALGRLRILMEIYATHRATNYERFGGGYYTYSRPHEQVASYIANIKAIIYSEQAISRHLTKMSELTPHPITDWCEQVNTISTYKLEVQHGI